MSTHIKWKGYAIHDTNKWDEFKLIDFEPKPQSDHDVDIKIEYCGVCKSDVHTITNQWDKSHLPIIPGKEIVGTVARVGPAVKNFEIGDRVGVGAQIGSCLRCDNCKRDSEQYCPKPIMIYNAIYPPSTTFCQGGYSTAVRAQEQFVFHIPDGLKLIEAAPLLCDGLTVYSPLIRNGIGRNKSIGIVGVGGLGRLALRFAKALGYKKIIAFSDKHDDAKEFGASEIIYTDTDNGHFASGLEGTLDLIMSTTDIISDSQLEQYLRTLSIHGKLIVVAISKENLPLSSQVLSENGALIGASRLGSTKEVNEMLKLAVDIKSILPRIKELSMKDAGKAVQAVHNGNDKDWYVLSMDID